MKHITITFAVWLRNSIAFLVVAPSLAFAGTSVTGHVEDLSIQKDFGGFVFIQLDAPHSAPIACHINAGWTYTLPLQSDTDKKIFAMLMMARAMGQTITLRGAGGCNEFGSIESAVGVDTYQ